MVDHIRKAKTAKRTVPAGMGIESRGLAPEDTLGLERELTRLEALDPGAATVVRLRCYGGCSWEETANALGITVKMARGDWAFAIRRLGARFGTQLS